MKNRLSILAIALFSLVFATVAWADSVPEVSVTESAVESPSLEIAQDVTPEITEATEAPKNCASRDSKNDLPWTFEHTVLNVDGAAETCFCSGSCRFGICLWGSCTGSASCCISCHQAGCASIGCGPVIAGEE